MPPAEPPICENVLSLYLKKLNSKGVMTSLEINKKLVMSKI